MEIFERSDERQVKSKVIEIKKFLGTKINPGVLAIDDEGFEFTQI